MRENKIENYLRKEVEAAGWECLKFPPLFFRGFPDRIVLKTGGVCIFVELKAPKGRPTLVQRRVHDRLRRLGFRVEVLNSIEEVDAFMVTL